MRIEHLQQRRDTEQDGRYEGLNFLALGLRFLGMLQIYTRNRCAYETSVQGVRDINFRSFED